MPRRLNIIFALTVTGLSAAAARADVAAVVGPTPDEVMHPTTVPIVPLPPAVYGSVASVALMVALRCSRHRRWVTLRG